ncbi:MAG: elongator complex protein 3 [Clostridiaceae bacterium]
MKSKHRIIPIFVPHIGCIHNCVFCNQNSITGSEGSKEEINAEYADRTIKEYLETINTCDTTVEVSFFGGTFTAINIDRQRELLAVAMKYKENKQIDYIRLSTRPDNISSEILDHLKSYKVDVIELGVQSLDEEVLRLSGRGHTAEDVYEASRLIKEYGFTLGHQIMIGLPGDTLEKDIETTKKVIEMKPDICRIYPALIIKDTPMEKMYRQNRYIPYSLEKAVEVCKVIYSMLINSKINVIRVGLQATEEISEGKDIVAGPFHPAFRELVEGSIINSVLLQNIDNKFTGEVNIKINPKDISKLFAYKKKFFNQLIAKLSTKNLKIIQDNMISRGDVILSYGKEVKVMSIDDAYWHKEIKGYF